MKLAKESVAKKMAFEQRPKLFLKRERVQEMMVWCKRHVEYASHVVLFLLSYAFLLRTPSEALPVTVGKESGPCALFLEGDFVVLELRRTKTGFDTTGVDFSENAKW